MIVKLSGQLVEKKENSLVINLNGLFYEVLIPMAVLSRIADGVDDKGQVELFIYHYIQLSPGNAFPVLVGFLNTIERDFFLSFIKVSGIGPRAAVKALNKPISEIARAIDQGDLNYLKTLPGIGLQRAKEIVAKLQGKVGMYALIKDQQQTAVTTLNETAAAMPDWHEEALGLLLQLQYNRQEAKEMIRKALDRNKTIGTTEELLNEIYKQRIVQ
jgi:holliday junction DNA helicase RuvA